MFPFGAVRKHWFFQREREAMKIRIGRSGNAITLRIPMDIRRSWDLKYGDMVDLRENENGEKLIISKLGGSK